MQVCVGSGILLVALSFGSFALLVPMFAGFVGIMLGYTMLFGVEMISERIRKSLTLSIVGIILSVVGSLQILFDSLLAGYECETDPEVATQSDCIMTFILFVIIFINLIIQGVLFKGVHYHLRLSAALLNPASSGIVQI